MRALEERFWSKVDKTADCWLWTAAKMPKGYGLFWLNGAHRCAHRVAYELTTGTIPAGMLIDHACHTKACVNPAHLRPVTNKQNGENRRGATDNSTTGVRGVRFDTRTSSWRASVGHNGRDHNKRFTDLEEAAAWVTAKRLELFTHSDMDRTA